MHTDCPYCGKTIDADSGSLDRLLREHIQRNHEQGYRRSDSWHTCRSCAGRGKDVWGRICPTCNGSGII